MPSGNDLFREDIYSVKASMALKIIRKLDVSIVLHYDNNYYRPLRLLS